MAHALDNSFNYEILFRVPERDKVTNCLNPSELFRWSQTVLALPRRFQGAPNRANKSKTFSH